MAKTKIKTIEELMQNRDTRIQLCKHSLYLFGLYYFSHYFTHISPEFHRELCKDIQSLDTLEPRYLVACWFRDSSKTSWAKIDFTKKICYKQREYMLYWSKDKKISQDALLDISLNLQTNQRIIDDFWQLFYDTEKTEKKSKKTWVNDFLTTTWIRCRAVTTGQSPRWLVFDWTRPDHAVYDDVENNITKKSRAMTREVIEHFDELFSALAIHWTMIVCCNKISDTWSIAWLYDKFENNPKWKIFEKAVVEKWEITWKSRFVHTDIEAEEINKTKKDPKSRVASLESIKRLMNKDWRNLYEQEYLNVPLVDWERFFYIEKVDEAIVTAKEFKFKRDWNWKIWEEYDPLCDYRIGWDVSEGYWLDSSVIEVWNITTWEQAAEFESNEIPPWLLADEFIASSKNYWNCSITPERNSIGNAVITSIQEKWHWNLLTRQKVINKKAWWKENRYGWYTTATSKSKMLFDMQRDFNDWSLIIKSLPALREMRWFANWDLKVVSFDEEVSNHFDRVMGIAITNQCKLLTTWFSIQKKRVEMWEDSAATWMNLKFKWWKWRANFKR